MMRIKFNGAVRVATKVAGLAALLLAAPAVGLADSTEAPVDATSSVDAMAGPQSSSVSSGSSVRGIIRASETATLSAELNARILSIPFRDGDRFMAGDVLVSFDCERLDAEYAAGLAAEGGHRLAYESQARLNQYKAAGSTSVEQAKFELQKASAEAGALKARLAACKIVAPFAGRVIERTANAHEIAQPNQPLLKIIDDSHLELVLMVPSSWLGTLHKDAKFAFKVDETGKSYAAVVARIGGAIEPVSQSVRMIGEVSAPDALLLPGMSGAADFAQSGDQK
jgi:membrane fusion protein, multidrug efflux system